MRPKPASLTPLFQRIAAMRRQSLRPDADCPKRHLQHVAVVDLDVEADATCSNFAMRISRAASSSSSKAPASMPRATLQPFASIVCTGGMPERRCRFEE
jgi:hypothetical protein